MGKKKDSNIDYKYILGSDIETSKVKPDEYKSYSNDTKDDIERMNNYIQVPFLTNTKEIDIETGEFTGSVFNRTIDEWISYLNSVSSEDRIRIVYCQNLFYEMTFIMRQMNASMIVDEKELNDYGMTEVDGIMRSNTDVLYAVLDCCPHVIFRDSLALFNTPLKKMGDDLNKRLKTEYEKGNIPELLQFNKLDYDYSKVRLPWDDLEQLDYDYNERDNEIVLLSLYYYLKDRGINMKEIPLTSTSDTKQARKKFMVTNYSKGHLRGANSTKANVLRDYHFYDVCNRTYQGGFTGGNYRFINKTVKNVYSVDIKSSYPYQMVSRQFPLFSKKHSKVLKGVEAGNFYFNHLFGIGHKTLIKSKNKKEGKVKGYFALVEFKNLSIKKNSYLLDLSEAHCYNFLKQKGDIIINGKIKKVKEVFVYVNNVDLDRLMMLYNFEDLIIHELIYTTEKRYLPEGETGFILDNFRIKESIDKEKFPVEYALSKVRINSMYGVKVQSLVRDFSRIVNGEIRRIEYEKIGNSESEEYKEISLTKEEIYNNTMEKVYNRNGFEGVNIDVYSDGVYITSYARMQLMEMMVNLDSEGFDVVYADTDSLKFKKKKDNQAGSKIVSEMVYELLIKYNNDIINDNINNPRMQQYKLRFLDNADHLSESERERQFNKIVALGTWDIESEYKNAYGEKEIKPYMYFKTLGAKKYLYTTKEWDKVTGRNELKVHTTVAGCNKKGLPTAIKNHSKNSRKPLLYSIDLLFKPGTLFESSVSGRTTAEYERRSFDECMELTYKGIPLKSAGGVVINDTTYKLNVSENDSIVLENVDHENDWLISLDIEGNVRYNNEVESLHESA